MKLAAKAKIVRVDWGKEDHGINTFWFYMEWDSGGQGFGGIVLDAALEADLKSEFWHIFGTWEPVGREVELIKYSETGHDFGKPIEGFIYNGHRFELNEWRKKHFPDTKSLLEQEIERAERQVGWDQRDLLASIEKLATLKALR